MGDTTTLKNLIDKSNKILILVPDSNLDLMSSALVLCDAINSKAKNVSTVVHQKGLFSNSDISSSLLNANVVDQIPYGYVIRIDNSQNKVSGIEWKKTDTDINLFISVQNGFELDQKGLDFKKSTPAFDLIILMGVDDITHIQDKFPQLSNSLDNTTVVNLRNKNSSDEIGDYEIQDAKATTLSEVSYELLKELGYNLTKEQAEILLFGIYSGTQRFSTITNPKAFRIAGELNALGARIEKVKELLNGYDSIPIEKPVIEKAKNTIEVKRNVRKKEKEVIEETIKEKVVKPIQKKKTIEPTMINTKINQEVVKENIVTPKVEIPNAEATDSTEDDDSLQIPLRKAKTIPQRAVGNNLGSPNMITPPPLNSTGAQSKFNPPLNPSRRG